MSLRNLIVIVISAVVSLACYSAASKNRYASLFSEVVDVVQQESLKPVTEQELFDAAMDGMLNSLDEHSTYISGRNFKLFEEELKQEFGGVGMYLDVNPTSKELTVTSPIPDTPAFRAGIQTGDIIESIDGEDTKGKARRKSIEKLRGSIGEKVVLVLRRPLTGQTFRAEIVRELIPVVSIRGERRNDDNTWNYFLPEDSRLAYFHFTNFGKRTAEEFATALKEIDGRAEGLIIDLRMNAGGLLDQAVEVCDLILDSPVKIVETRSRGNKKVDPYFASSSHALNPNTPIVVLIDRFSASTSEIVAACLQDHHRATVIGERSYGKGTVQNVIPLEYGKSSIKLTTASYWSPAGRNIDRSVDISGTDEEWGVEPNPGFKIELTEKQLAEVYLIRSKRQLNVLEFEEDDNAKMELIESGEPMDGRPEKESGQIPPADMESEQMTEDPCLNRAIEYLQSAIKQSVAA